MWNARLMTVLVAVSAWVNAAQAANEPQTAHPKIIVAMTAAFVSEKGTQIYDEISQYLARKTALPIEFINGLSYSTVNEMLADGAVQMAFVCGYPYVLAHDGVKNSTVNLLAAPVSEGALYKGQPKYYSYVVVAKDSAATSLKDLKGKRYVYNDEISNSGYNMPRAHMVDLGLTEGYFGEMLKSGSHEESIRMVAAGKADVSAVDSLVYDYALNQGEDYAKQVKIIETLGPAGIPPVVSSASLTSEDAQKIKKALLEMSRDPEGAAILKKAYLKEFVDVADANYDDIRAMHVKAVSSSYLKIK